MSRGTAGSLVVSLGLDAADYTRGLTKAEYEGRKFGEAIGSAIRTGAIAGFAALTTASVAAFAIMNRQVEQIAGFKGLSEQIGDTASAVQGLKLASDISGVSLEAVGSASAKLTSTLAKTDDEAKGAGAAIKALGLNLDDFKKQTPTEQLRTAATAFSSFEDGAGKTAVAIALFGKAGKDLIPFLNDLADAGETNYRLTNEQIAAVDEHAKAQARMKSEVESLVNVIVAESVPALDTFTKELKKSIVEALNLGGSAGDLSRNHGIREFAQDSAIALAILLESLTKVGEGLFALGSSVAVVSADIRTSFNFATTAFSSFLPGDEFDKQNKDLKASIDQRARILESANKRYSDLTSGTLGISDRLRDAFKAMNNGAGAGGGRGSQGVPSKPQIDTSGLLKASGSKDDPTKKELDNALKDLERAVKQEQDILTARNKMLDLYNGEALISTQDYYAGKRVALEDNVAKESALYDKEIAALQAYQASAAKATERETAQGKINDLVEKKAKLYRDAGEAALEMGFKERKSAEDLQKQLNSVNADVLELTGNLAAASKIRLDAQYDDLSKRLTANGDSAGLAQLDRLKKLKTAQAEIGQQSEEISRITSSLQVQEDRISLSRQIGADTELSALVKTGEARSAAVAQMEAYVTAQEAIAKASGNPALVQNAERARVELEKLQAVADPLGDKLSSIFVDSFGDAFADFITGTKSASEAFQAFGKSVISQLAKIAAQEAATTLFGKSSSGGGMGGLFGSLFGTGSAAVGDLTGTSIGGTYGSSTQAGLDSLFASLTGKAAGGSVAANSLHEVNENGPELLDYAGRQYLMMGDKAGKVIPNGGSSGDGTISIVNQTTGRVDNVVEQRVSPTERVLIMQETRKAVWSELSDRNSMGSKAMSRNFRNLERA